jgi:putative radical SAM enzyme (TIGR03279 family)
MRDHGLIIEAVDGEGIAGELGLEPGDAILRINNTGVSDILDYRFLTAEENLEVLVQKTNGEHWVLEIEKDYDEPLGIRFRGGGWGRTRRCGNKCIFCFVDQMPGQMRSTLYVKDDDYRLSFAQGNFITLTNIGPGELERIARLHLSPLYISVHTTNPELRRKIMGNPRAGKIMEQLRYLAGAGIEMHTQVVLCPGINDGAELERTVSDLGGLWPAVRSLAVVPVGLTGHRRGLYGLRPYTGAEARLVVTRVHQWQDLFMAKYEYPLVFAGDEFYLLAQIPVPQAEKYGGFPQTENGVGLVRLFWDEWNGVRKCLPARVDRPVQCSIVTGTLAAAVLGPVVAELGRISGVNAALHVLENKFFGKTVTVAGLLTGKDLLDGLAGRDLGERLYIPKVMLRAGEKVFLDDITVDELSGRLKVPVIPVSGPGELVASILSGTVTGDYYGEMVR